MEVRARKGINIEFARLDLEVDQRVDKRWDTTNNQYPLRATSRERGM